MRSPWLCPPKILERPLFFSRILGSARAFLLCPRSAPCSSCQSVANILVSHLGLLVCYVWGPWACRVSAAAPFGRSLHWAFLNLSLSSRRSPSPSLPGRGCCPLATSAYSSPVICSIVLSCLELLFLFLGVPFLSVLSLAHSWYQTKVQNITG